MADARPKEMQIVFYVGTHKLSVFAGEVGPEGARIHAHREKYQPDGFENGLVVNLEAAAAALDLLITEMVPQASSKQLKAYVVLGNSKLHLHKFSSARYFPAQRTVTTHDVRSVIDQTRSVSTLPLNQFVLQTIPESFLVNDMDHIANPLGLETTRLGVHLNIFTMDFEAFKNISKAFEAADIKVQGYWPRMLTVSETVLSEREKEEGVILIDIADPITQLVLWKNQRLAKVKNLEKGGKNLTRAIAAQWDIEFHDAERLKERFSSLEAEADFGDELIPLVQRNGKGSCPVRRQEFQTKFLEFAENWLEEILSEVDILAVEAKLKYPHLVFSGGGTSFSGFVEFFNHRFGQEARLGTSHQLEAPQEVIVDPSLTAASGMYRWLANNAAEYANLVAHNNLIERTLASAKEWFYEYF